MPLITVKVKVTHPLKLVLTPAKDVQPVKIKNSFLRFNKYWTLVVLYAIFIFLVSSVEGKNLPGLFVGQEVIFHFFEYCLFAFLLSRAIKEYFPQKKHIIRIIWIIVFAAGFAALDEWHQSFVAGRTASVFDFFIDCAGIFLGAFLKK